MTTIEPSRSRLSRLGRMRRSNDTITIVVVRLSSTADMKNASVASTHMIFHLERVRIWSVTSLNEPCRSMTSTSVMAPSRKNTICATSLSSSAS